MPQLTNRLWWKKQPLAVMLTLTMTALVVVVVASVTLLSIRREQQAFQTELEQQAELLLATLAAAAADPLYSLNADDLSDMVEALGVEALGAGRQILASGRIYDATGRIIGDAYDSLLAFSLNSDPFGQQLVNSDTIVFDWQPDQVVAGRAVVVGSQRLGAVSVGLPTAPLQAKLAAVRNQGLAVAVATTVVGILLALLLSRSITYPLRELVSVTEHIANGDLTQKITISGSGELATLGSAMEQMRLELQRLYLGLEQAVADRTKELRDSEERFRQVISSVSDHIYMTEITKDGKQINRFISPNVKNLTGYPPEKIMADWHFWPSKLIHPDDRATAAAQVEQFTQGHSSEVEYRLARADGRIIWVRDNARVERDAARQSLIVYGLVSDITERKQAEETLALAHDKALEASRLKSELLAKVSHELRTPLGAILGYTQLLWEGIYGSLSEPQRKVTTDVIASTEYLTSLVNELLDQAQLEADSLKLNISPFDLKEMVNQVEAKMCVLAQAKGLTLSIGIDADMPATLPGDQNRLQQILINLVNNAIKFTEAGTVQACFYRPNAEHWAMQVSDTGLGIPVEAQSYIFEPFRQVDGSVTRAHVGTGLGLSIVKQLTTLMGGRITLESEIGRGSTFTILLPLTPIQEYAA